MKIADIAHLNRKSGMYVLFGLDKYLYIAQTGGLPVPVAHLKGISTEGVIKLYVHEPWVCVTERFGTHAALVSLENVAFFNQTKKEKFMGNWFGMMYMGSSPPLRPMVLTRSARKVKCLSRFPNANARRITQMRIPALNKTLTQVGITIRSTIYCTIDHKKGERLRNDGLTV